MNMITKRMGCIAIAKSLVLMMSAVHAAVDCDVRLGGTVGRRLDKCVRNQLEATDAMRLARVFADKDESSRWQTEFWGKYMHSAVPFARYFDSAILRKSVDESTAFVRATQLADGYIGNYHEKKRGAANTWDVWGVKYTLLGLLYHYDLTGDGKSLQAACRLADWLIGRFGDGRLDIAKSGCHCGTASCSVLEPIVWLYRITSDEKYGEFAAYIVRRMGAEAKIFASTEKPIFARRELYKGYETMSCLQGLVDFSEISGRHELLDTVMATAMSILKTEITLAGGACSNEFWVRGAVTQSENFPRPQETCVTTTWMRLAATLLEKTDDPMWADAIERTFYNAFLGALRPDGSVFAQYSPIASGYRTVGEKQCGLDTNCCNANGPRGFLVWLGSFLKANDDVVTLNFYGESTASVVLPRSGEKVVVEQKTKYPAESENIIVYRGSSSSDFALRLRIPHWSVSTKVAVNGKDVEPAVAGTYMTIRRMWTPGDCIRVTFDMPVRMQRLDNHVAFMRGPILLARDIRFRDGELLEEVRTSLFKQTAPEWHLEEPSTPDMLMCCELVLPLGVHDGEPVKVRFCDYASAGATWGKDSYFRSWLSVLQVR